MAKWKNISQITDQATKKREAEFEAQMLSFIAPTPPVSMSEAVQVTIIEGGQTITYKNLESVPLPVRQRIVNAWLASPNPSVQK